MIKMKVQVGRAALSRFAGVPIPTRRAKVGRAALSRSAGVKSPPGYSDVKNGPGFVNN